MSRAYVCMKKSEYLSPPGQHGSSLRTESLFFFNFSESDQGNGGGGGGAQLLLINFATRLQEVTTE